MKWISKRGISMKQRRNGMVIRKAFCSFIKILWWKIKYGKRLETGIIQGFQRVQLEIDNEATVRLGAKLQNRGNLYIGCKEKGELVIGSHCFFKLIPRFLSHHPRPPFLSVFHFVCIVLPLFQERKLYLKKIRIS